MSYITNISIQDVQTLLEDLEAGDLIAAGDQLDKLTQMRNHELYVELGKMTRNLHETLKSVEDVELMQQVKHDLPDVSERLDYVLSSTEQASAQTLAASEQLVRLLGEAAMALETMPAEQTQGVTKLLDDASNEVTKIMSAQSYQDLTGQVLNRIKIVMSAFEHSLLDLIARAGHDLGSVPERSADSARQDEMKGIGPNVTQNARKDSVQSQDEVDDLLAELGF